MSCERIGKGKGKTEKGKPKDQSRPARMKTNQPNSDQPKRRKKIADSNKAQPMMKHIANKVRP